MAIYRSGDFPGYLPQLRSLYNDLFAGGKGFRSQLVKKSAKVIDLSLDETNLLSQTIEFIHNASLLHDDFIDRSPVRRNRAAAWTKYSEKYAVLAGDYLLARVMVHLSAFGNLELIAFTAKMISDLVEGEWLQDSVKVDLRLNLEEMDRVHHLKTSSLFRWCLSAPYYAARELRPRVYQELDHMGSILGLLFQRSDDLLDFDVRNFERKSVFDDLLSGYLNSFALFLADDHSLKRREELLKCRTLDQVHEIFGLSYYEGKLKEFDKKNDELIALYTHHLQLLAEVLGGEKGALLNEELGDLAHLLYYRTMHCGKKNL